MSENQSESAPSPTNPHGWPLGVRVYPPMSGDVRLLKLTAKKTVGGNYTVACTANGDQIEVHVKNTPADIGQGVIDLENGLHGVPVK